jgi:dTDP-4-dehydrorhamnose 3,5-epimerase-like enzyme
MSQISLNQIASKENINLDFAKKVKTYDLNGKENGFLIELTKNGNLTTSYLSCCYPGAFKGYHLHSQRAANYVCVRGKITIILYTKEGKQEYLLDSVNNIQKIHIPKDIPTGLWNHETEECWIINTPDFPYDPATAKEEQLDFSEEELKALYQS